MFKNPLKLNNIKNKFLTIVLCVICTVIFVYIGVKASSNLSSAGLLVGGSGNFSGELNIKNGKIYIPNITEKKFSVDNSGNVSINGEEIIKSTDKIWHGSKTGLQGIPGIQGSSIMSTVAGDPGSNVQGPQGIQGPQGDKGPVGSATIRCKTNICANVPYVCTKTNCTESQCVRIANHKYCIDIPVPCPVKWCDNTVCAMQETICPNILKLLKLKMH